MQTSRWLIVLMVCCWWASVAEAVQISLPSVEGAPGERVRVPVAIGQFEAGDEIVASNLDIRFSSALVVLDQVAVDRSGSLAERWIMAANPRPLPGGEADEGQVLIGGATARNKIAGDGVFFFLELVVSADAAIGATSPLRIEKVQLNNGTPIAITVDGLLTVIDNRLNADFYGNPLAGEAPLEVGFEDLSSGEITTWDWNFGDGGTSSAQHPVHVYADPGIYTVELTVSNASSAATATKEDYIEVSADQQAPEIIEGPTAQGTTHNSTHINWVTNEESTSLVEYCRIQIRPDLANESELIELLVDELVELGYLPGGGGGDDDEGDDDEGDDEEGDDD